ncbi:MAG: hypothetical protein HQ567_08965 [Candidatus Nealsonbacteria bacterium]|nr:hypothetical protein [Candidatus Nealsonbacteria bacterium]
MKTRTAVTTTEVIVATLILVAVVVAVAALIFSDPWGERPLSHPDRDVDPALVHYRQTREIPVDMQYVSALAVGPTGDIYVAGDRAIHVFAPDGTKRDDIDLDEEPTCLAVAGANHAKPDRLYVAMRQHVEVVTTDGRPVAKWETIAKANVTSIAAADEDIFVADAANKIVWRYAPDGTIQGRIGDPDKKKHVPGFVITTPFFDLAMAPDGLLRVVNPRLLRIEAYTIDGDLEGHWGTASPDVDGFYGCCNPIHFAIFSDGRFVTAEKGVQRIKIYDKQGQFDCVVAGPEQMTAQAGDLAVDHNDRVLALDPIARCVRIFEYDSDKSTPQTDKD